MERCLELNGLRKEDIDVFLFHQATKYIIDNLANRMKLSQEKVPFMIKEYGNTVSSSIPLMLKNYLFETEQRNMLLCGFGVGLSLASTILRRL
jgi:3-oxoacyl-[acyl-carrier-protein] synthase-3